MKVQSHISDTDISSKMNDLLNETIFKMERVFVEAGILCLENIRSSQGYQNRTGNLHDSCGFAVANDGNIIHISNFPNSEGGIKGRSSISERVSNLRGLALVVIAGEEYAEIVENRGFNVISSGELLAHDLVPKMLKQLKITAND